eukprot:gene4069-2918_t
MWLIPIEKQKKGGAHYVFVESLSSVLSYCCRLIPLVSISLRVSKYGPILMWRLHFVYVAFSTVVKLIGAVIPGMVISHHLAEPIHSEQGFSFITLRVFLSCMLFANLCMDVSMSLLKAYFWAVLMSLIPMILGILSSLCIRKLLPDEWRVLLVLGSTFQNGLAFPLSVVSNIKGVPWLDSRAIAVCQQYVFLYNLTCAVGLWSVGSLMVKHYKDKLIEKHEDEMEEQYFHELDRKAAESLVYEDSRREQPMDTLSSEQNSHSVSGASPTSSHSPGGKGSLFIATGSPLSGASAHFSRRSTDLFSRSPSLSPTTLSGSPRGMDWYRPSRRHAHPIDLRKYKKYVERGELTPSALKAAKREKKERRRQRARDRSSVSFQEDSVTSPQKDSHGDSRKKRFNSTPHYHGFSSGFSSADSSGSSSQSPEKKPLENSVNEISRTLAAPPEEERPQPLPAPPAFPQVFLVTSAQVAQKDREADRSHPNVDPSASADANTTLDLMVPPDFVEDIHENTGVLPQSPSIVPATSELELRFRDRPFTYRLYHAWEIVKFVLLTPPITLSIIGITVALIPPLHWLGSTALGTAIIQGFAIIGTGCVPVQLLTLGIILSPNNLKVDTNVVPTPGLTDPGGEEEERRDTEAQDLAAAQSTNPMNNLLLPLRWIRKQWQRLPPAIRLSILCLTLRLLLLPACAFCIVHGLLTAGIMPSDKPFVISILIGVSSPAAVNASLVCTMHGYYPRQFAKMIFTMYCVAAITSTFWISVSITYATHMT